MLPNESLLQVLHYADYKTVVLATRAGRRFLHLAIKFADELARRPRFRVNFFATYITYSDETTTIGGQGSIQYAPVLYNAASLTAACRELAEVIGPYAVATLTFGGNSWNVPDPDVIFDAAPPLKYADEVLLYSFNPDVSNTSEAFMSNFSGIKSLSLCFDCGTFRQFSWTFLRRESARELRLIKFTTNRTAPAENVDRSVEELVRECVTRPRLPCGEALELDFSESYISAEFALRITEMLKHSDRELTFRMTLQGGGELKLDDGDYSVDDVEGTTRRYSSETIGIVVEVKGRSVTIQSTAEVSPRREAAEQTNNCCQ